MRLFFVISDLLEMSEITRVILSTASLTFFPMLLLIVKFLLLSFLKGIVRVMLN
jgi:hypothetical protein